MNFGGRYQDATKDGRLPAEVAFLVGPTATSFGPFAPIPPGNNGGVPAVGTVEAERVSCPRSASSGTFRTTS